MTYFSYIFSGINAAPTIILIFILFYWLLTILGFISSDQLDLDIDCDADLDIDYDVTDMDLDLSDLDVDGSDVDVDLEAPSESVFIKVLKFTNLNTVPLMLYLSILGLALWFLTMMGYYLKINPKSMKAIGMFFINLILSIIITKFITTPLKGIFSNMEINNNIKMIGKKGILLSDTGMKRIGQLEYIHNNYPIVINVVSVMGEIKKGEEVIIISKMEEKNLYLVKKQL